jgi:arabinose-5-phosphate isomerase
MNTKALRLILKEEIKALKNIPIDESYDKVLHILYEHVHTKSGKIVTSGMGKAGQIALNIATTFSSTGSPSLFLHPSEAQHGDLGVLQKDDVLLVLSNSGKTREILELIELARNLIPNIPVIGITRNPDSDLVKVCDMVLLTGQTKEVCTLGLCPTTSTTVMTVIGDLLVVSLMDLIGFTPLEYSKRHHGGYLGQASRERI